jgi:hypothetical protein
MQREHAFEHAMASLIIALRQSGFALEALDLMALAKLCRPVALVETDNVVIPLIQPIGDWAQANAADFDRRVVAAGLIQFARPAMAGDGMPPGAVVEVGQGRPGS